MSFANTRFLWYIPAAILITFIIYLFNLYQQKKLRSWIDESLWPTIIPEYKKHIFKMKYLFMGISLVFLCIGIARPQWGEKEEIIESQGMDIVFLLDLSRSMLAEDVSPSRMGRAQTFIKKTLQQLADDRVGVVGFAGNAQLAVPLTTDFQYVSEVVDTLDPNAIVQQGTNIGEAIDAGIKALERSGENDHKTSRAFVLISDGEDFGEDAIKSAQRLKEFGAAFFAFSTGTSEGAPIPLRNESGILQTYKKDNSQKTILTRVNKELMAKIAEAGGGKYYELINTDDAATILTRGLLGVHRNSQKEQHQITKIDRYQLFLLISIFFLLLSFFTGYQKASLFNFKSKALLLLFLFSIHDRAQAQTLDSYLKGKEAAENYQNKKYEESAKAYEASRSTDSENPVLEFNEATALAKAKKSDDAKILFNEATKKALSTGDYATAAKSFYNNGVTQSQAGNLEESYDQLTKAIELSKISNQPELEKLAREAMIQNIDKQKQKSKQEQESKDQQKKDQNGSKKDQKDSSGDQKDKKDQDQQNKENEQNKNGPPQEKRGNFKSGTLSKDTAESIMNDLSDREKQLFQKRLRDQKQKEIKNEKDW